MFQFAGKLEHVLPPKAYFDPEWFEAERKKIFHKEWMLFCLAQEVEKPGDRFARDFYGVPVVVWNHEGDLHALRNVCGHRHSEIVKHGHSCGSVLKCQIHGWEYNCEGKLTQMPDGRHFRVVKAPDFALGTFQVAKAGPFIYVKLSEGGPSFEEHLGALAPEFHRFYDDLRLIDIWTTEHDVNWKIILENGIESYHVPMVHPNTYQDYRDEELHDHRLEPTYTRYGDLLPYSAEKNLESVGFRLYTRMLIKNPTFKRFTHTHLFPAQAFYYGDIYSGANVVEPLGPERTRFTMYSFVPRQIYWGLPGRMVQNLSMKVFLRMGRKIINEDVHLWPPVQRGLKASPHKGVISAREERVYAFQKYVHEQMNA